MTIKVPWLTLLLLTSLHAGEVQAWESRRDGRSGMERLPWSTYRALKLEPRRDAGSRSRARLAPIPGDVYMDLMRDPDVTLQERQAIREYQRCHNYAYRPRDCDQ